MISKGVSFGAFAIAMQLLLYSNTLHSAFGSGLLTGKMALISFSRLINGITSLISDDNATYSESVVLRVNSVCSLLDQRAGQPA